MGLSPIKCEFESLLGHHKDPYDIASLYMVVSGSDKTHRILDVQVEVSETGLKAIQIPNIEFTVLDSFIVKEIGVEWHGVRIPAPNYESMRLPAWTDARICFSQNLVHLEYV